MCELSDEEVVFGVRLRGPLGVPARALQRERECSREVVVNARLVLTSAIVNVSWPL